MQLVDQILNFIDIDSKTYKLLNRFEIELINYINPPDQKKLILVIEDSRLLREKIRNTLEIEKYKIMICDNSDDGYKILQETSIDLVICDISTPMIGTSEMLYKIKQNSKYKTLPIVMLCSEKNNELFAIGKYIKAKAWLLKSFENNKLLEIIGRILD